jgi:alanyl-tRNA synthetase
MIAWSTDKAISKGFGADQLVKKAKETIGASGGGKPHFAQGKLTDPSKATFSALFPQSA